MSIGNHVAAQACIVCANDNRRVIATLGRGLKPLTTAMCPSCGLVSHHPLPNPDEVAAFYASKYRVDYKGGWEPKRKHALRAIRGAAARARRLAPLIPSGAHVLDIGASSGEFTYAMMRLGYRAFGVEPNHGYAAFARRTYGVDVARAPIEDAVFGAGAFSLVTLNHVLEHLTDPIGVLAKINLWLEPGGFLFLEVPNLEGVRKQVINTFHFAHIWNFAPATLTALARRGGFEPIDGEDPRSTSLVFRKAGPPQPSLSLPQLGVAETLLRQLANEQSFAAYVLSGAPFSRRWRRLQRNVDELATVRRYASVREMADAILDATPIHPRRAGLHAAA